MDRGAIPGQATVNDAPARVRATEMPCLTAQLTATSERQADAPGAEGQCASGSAGTTFAHRTTQRERGAHP